MWPTGHFFVPETTNTHQLARLLQLYFSAEEFSLLCANLHIGMDNLPNKSFSGQVNDFVTHLIRRGRLLDFSQEATRLCPQANWQNIIGIKGTPDQKY